MTTRETKALEALLGATLASQLSSQTLVGGPGSIVLTIASQIILEANAQGIVVVCNNGIQDGFFAYDQDAEAMKGIVVVKTGDRFPFPIAEGVNLHGITAMGTTEISFLFFST